MSSAPLAAASPALPPQRTTDLFGALAALIAESGLVVGHQWGFIPLLVGVAGHMAITAVLLMRYVARVRRGRDGAASLLLAFVVFVSGPFGALGGLVIGWLARPERGDAERLDDWYDRISFSSDLSATTRRSDRVLTGRVADLKADMPKSFGGVLEHGSVREKQVVLGLIARRFHPDYLPALKLALVSDEPVIRVQAAAVAAKIRVDLAARAEASLSAAADPSASLDRVLMHLSDAEKYVASGLMEEPDRHRAQNAIDVLMASFAKHAGQGPVSRAALAERVETRLLAERRFADFRYLRRAARWRTRGGFRFRPIKSRRRRTGAAT